MRLNAKPEINQPRAEQDSRGRSFYFCCSNVIANILSATVQKYFVLMLRPIIWVIAFSNSFLDQSIRII